MRKQPLLLGLIAALFLGLGLRSLDLEQLYSPDSAEFSMLPRAMLAGFSRAADRSAPSAGIYNDISQPGDPPHTKYPFGYPLLLLPAAILFPANAAAYLLACKLTTLLLGALSLLGIHRLLQAQAEADSSASLLAVLLCAATPVIVLFSSNVMSEVPLLCLSVWTLYLVQKRLSETAEAAAPGRRRLLKPLLDCAIVSAAIAATYFVRGNGIVLLPAAALHVVLRGQGSFWGRTFKAVLLGVLVTASVLPWVWRDMKVSKAGRASGENYVSQILTPFENPFKKGLDAELALKRVRMNAKYYFKVSLGHVFPFGDMANSGVENYAGIRPAGTLAAAAGIVRWLILVLVVSGIGAHLRSRGLDLFIVYPAFFAGLLIVFTYRQHRYLLPLIPFTYYFMLKGLGLVSRLGAGLRAPAFGFAARGLGGALAGAMLVSNSLVCAAMIGRKTGESLMPVIGAYLDASTKKDDVVMGYPYLWFFSGRKCLPFDPKSVSVPGFESVLAGFNVKYIVAGAWISDLTEYDTMLYSSSLFGFKKAAQLGNIIAYKVERLKKKERDEKVKEAAPDFAGAIKRYELFSREAAASPDYHNTLGYFYYQQSRFREAIAEFKKAAALAPEDHIARFNLGTAYLGDDQYDAALVEYDAVRECEFGYTIQHVLNKNIEIAVLKRGISVDPDEPGNSFIYFQVARMWAERGSYRKAIKELDRAVKLNPEFLDARLFLAENYAAIGEYGRAVKEYEAVLEKHPEAAAVKARLRETRKLAKKRGRGKQS